MRSLPIQERCIGLDPLSRSTMKLFVQDILHLEPVSCPNLKGTGLLSFEGHVVNRVEVMGIIVSVDKREKRHSYADNLKDIPRAELPSSLQEKLDELRAVCVTKNEDGFDIGDLMLVRGCVKMYQDQLEIDVLDHRKIENLCLEYERVLQMPSLYKLYNQPVKLPDNIEKVVNQTDQGTISKEAVESAIAREIQACFSSAVRDPAITPESVLTWPAVAELLSTDRVSRQGKESER
ncbi:CST complex subunit STN1 [Elysia marginata]|uniref:CST complex subunit STN1 n=1 Tax=Elysia marginata TaxID=1093978 RepID=A0AAV4GKR1_9GAST|nr:CST complex subunit STN1 [Elysia marginata]